jgi:hypothetical protein
MADFPGWRAAQAGGTPMLMMVNELEMSACHSDVEPNRVT